MDEADAAIAKPAVVAAGRPPGSIPPTGAVGAATGARALRGRRPEERTTGGVGVGPTAEREGAGSGGAAVSPAAPPSSSLGAEGGAPGIRGRWEETDGVIVESGEYTPKVEIRRSMWASPVA